MNATYAPKFPAYNAYIEYVRTLGNLPISRVPVSDKHIHQSMIPLWAPCQLMNSLPGGSRQQHTFVKIVYGDLF